MAVEKTPEEIAGWETKKAIQRTSVELAEKLDVLTPRQRDTITNFLSDMDGGFHKAAKKAGYSLTQGSKASSIRKKLEGVLGDSLTELGVNLFDFATKLHEGMNAMKIVATIKTPIYEGDKIVDYDVRFIEKTDLAMRLRYLESTAKFTNLQPATKLKVEHTHGLAPRELEALRERERALSGPIEAEVIDVSAIN